MRFAHAPGDRPLDGYTLKRGVGRGGFGEVYLATSDGGKEVALKLVQRNLDIELRGVGQCLNLKHANLVGLHDVRQSADGDHWVVMEYVAGETLDQVIAQNPHGMPPDEVLAWLRGLCDGVGHLHTHGLVHRDLKPGNIFREGDTVKVGDYGLSKFLSASRRSGQTTSVGTVYYMAPEVAKGRYGREVDFYAIGVMLYEMLTGRLPFDGQSPGEVLMKHLTSTPDLELVPPAWRPVVSRLLSKDPYLRYSSVEAMFADLQGYLAAPPAASYWPAPEPQPASQPAAPSRSPAVITKAPSQVPWPISWLSALTSAGPLVLYLTMAVCFAVGGGLLIASEEYSRQRNYGRSSESALLYGMGSTFMIFGGFLVALFLLRQMGRLKNFFLSGDPRAGRDTSSRPADTHAGGGLARTGPWQRPSDGA